MPFVSVGLSMNIGKLAHLAEQEECNPGGSTICTAGTAGCGAGGLTCVGTSSSHAACGSASDILDLGFDSRILVEEKELKSLHEQLVRVVREFGARR
jgi:hypothetical protein